MIDGIKLFSEQKEIKDIDFNRYKTMLVAGGSANHNILFVARHFKTNDDTIFYVAKNLYSASNVYETFCDLIGKENVNFYVTDDIVSVEALAVSNEFRLERLHALRSLIFKEKKIIVTCIQAFLRPVLRKEVFEKNTLLFEKGKTIDVNLIVKALIATGYKRTPITAKTGDFSVRGEVLDIFPVNMNTPVRIDMFGDEIEYIKTFDAETQRTTAEIASATCFPIAEMIYGAEEGFAERIKKDATCPDEIYGDLLDIENHENNEKIYKYINYLTSEQVLLCEYAEKGIVFVDDFTKTKENYLKTKQELEYFLQDEKKYKGLDLTFFRDFSCLASCPLKKVYFAEYLKTMPGLALDKIWEIDGTYKESYRGNIKYFIDFLNSSSKTVLIVMHGDLSYDLIKQEAKRREIFINETKDAKEIKEGKINICKSPFNVSFGFMRGIDVVCEENIFSETGKEISKYRSTYQNTAALTQKEDLAIGDYVVHVNYGIARYQGIKEVTLHGIANDYLSLRFADTEMLVPVERINYIEKYLGSGSYVPKLSSAAGDEWKRKKKRIKEKVEDLAESLIETEAQRAKIKGYKYPPDDEIQKAFEDEFTYVLTPDQSRAICDIKSDMEKGIVIDRLVCGDVGYGKTEVALRIAFKAVLAGKQVAYLAPTTILTRQQYLLFKARFAPYGIKVAMLNRLVPLSGREKTIRDLKENKINVVIGTHSLLGAKAGFFDLGLLIVDEEQRFGVTHKEKIKKLKSNVNVITLTATPIPRTLQMSIMGIRQFSLINTPPKMRYPVQTYVLEKNDIIVREAIYRELGRGGQVFYLDNSVEDLPVKYRKLRKIVPDAKIVIAHGQMPRAELENAVQDFIDRKFDILLCTTIIENGIDIPNVNTLIAEGADRLGLAQMYQIRGRVGRGNKISYAYFMFEKGKVLTDSSDKRLKAIKEFTRLGSGYKIAMRDLAIRGAGEILGKKQSGFIDEIGIELYLKLLEDAIKRLKGIETKEEARIDSNIAIEKHVKDEYTADDDIKIYIHRKIKAIKTRKEKETLQCELEDRFGKLSASILLYMDKQYMENLLKEAGVAKILDQRGYFEITFKKDANLDFNVFAKIALKTNRNYTFSYQDRCLVMKAKIEGQRKERIAEITEVMERYFKEKNYVFLEKK